MKILEKGTYGGSKCVHDLVDILNEENNRPQIKLVSRILVDYFFGFNDILKTQKITETLMMMWLIKYKQRVDDANLGINIKNRLKNLMIAKYKSNKHDKN